MSDSVGADRPGAGSTGGVTREQIAWGYRLLLGREPESEGVIEEKMNFPSRVALTRDILASAEFRSSELSQHSHRDFFSRMSPPIEIEHDADPRQLRRLVERVGKTWHALGEARPHWSVLASDQFLPHNIAAEEENFFASGAGDLQQVLATIARVGRRPEEFATVLEYGCGLGRIANHFATTFKAVIGCDISASHLELARARSRRIGALGITYRTISAPEFGMTEAVDLWYSILVLQHNPPPVIAAILRRMLHMLRAGGLAIFHVPTYAPDYRFRIDEYLAQPLDTRTYEMHVLPQSAIFDLVRDAGCRVIEVVEDGLTGNATWLSNEFVIGK